jgi:adenylate cyclase
MFTTDKIKIGVNRFFTNITFQFIFWTTAFLFYVFLTGKNNIINNFSNQAQIYPTYLFIISIAIFTAILFSIIDTLFSDRIIRFFPIQLTLLIKSTLYFLSAFVIIFAASIPANGLPPNYTYKELILQIPDTNIHLFRFLIFFYIVCFLNSLLKDVFTKIGRGNLKNWFFGILNKPREEERIFMFIDLKSSTTIAEKLGHKKFSHLIQDVFNDLAIVDNYKGEIYQYLGDGAIISWTIKSGLSRNNFIKAFFAVAKVLNNRKRYYRRKYKLTPHFKAGVHVGKVMVLQIGKIRRDISYNGDTMNTAARIESKCNELKSNLLISGILHDMIQNKKRYKFKSAGEILLKGKRKPMEIYKVM